TRPRPPDRALRTPTGLHLRKPNAGLTIPRHTQELPAGSLAPIARIAGDAVTHAHDTAKLLGVDMQQIARMLVLIAHARLARRQIRPARQSRPRQNPAHRAWRHLQAVGDSSMGQEAPAQLY